MSARDSLPDWLLALGEQDKTSYVVTEKGQEAMLVSDSCACNEEVEQDGCYVCPDCGTVHGTVMGEARRRLKTWALRRYYS